MDIHLFFRDFAASIARNAVRYSNVVCLIHQMETILITQPVTKLTENSVRSKSGGALFKHMLSLLRKHYFDSGPHVHTFAPQQSCS